MKFVVFGEGRRLGLLDGDRILDLAAAAGDEPGSNGAVFSSLLSLIEAGDAGLDLAEGVAEKAHGSDRPALFTALSDTQLHAPWPGGRLLLAGYNYANHMAQASTNKGRPITAEEFHANARKGAPATFWAAARPVMGPGDRIEIPSRAAGYFDFEAEGAVVIGRRGKDVRAADAAAYIWGVTNVVDWSIRDPSSKPLDAFVSVKNFDCSKSIGPCIAVRETRLEDLTMETIVNGELRQRFSLTEMIFSFGEIFESVSRDFTFYPGDAISTGTGTGTAVDQTVASADGSWPTDLFLKVGDQVEVRSQVGSFTSHIVAKAP